jgi:penicillin-binding protein 2B
MQKQKNMKLGAAVLFALFSLLFFVLLGRFLYIGITGTAGGEVLAAKAEKKYEQQRVIEAERGSILDTNGEVIAEDTTSYTLIAILDESMTTNSNDPQHVTNPQMTAKKLAEYIDMDQSDIYEQLTNEEAFQVEFGSAGRDLSHEVKQKIEQLELPGIAFTRDYKRFYPNGIFASHLIGYVEKDSETNATVGKLGIEQMLNSELEETDGKVTYDSDSWGLLLPNSEESVTAPQNGNDVTLTIDKKIQTFLEDSMSKVQEKYNPEQIIAIVSNPKTGEILAMGQRPTFHPATKEGLTETWHNLAIEESFEPGSTMKAFTLAAAVEEGVFNPEETFVAGTYPVKGTSPITDHSGIPRGQTMTYLEGIQRSSNVSMAKLLEKMGEETFRKYLTKFGLDKKTGIDLPFETGGIIQYKYERDKISTSFGQATAITPIQQIQATSAIANDGKMMKPYVIKEITDGDTGKTIKQTKPTVAGQPISAETARKVREYLGTVITAERGTGKKYNIEGYEVAGKTGTAQISENGQLLTGKNNYIFSVLGMAPKDDPQLVMYVAVKQPKLGATAVGSDPLSDIFNPVMKSSLQYLNIEPNNLEDKKATKIEDFTDQPVKSVSETLKKTGYEVVTIGKGESVIDQSPKEGTVLLEGEKVILRTEGNLLAPDVSGWSLRDVMKLANVAELTLKTSGTGYVAKQSIPAGKALKADDTFTVELKSPEDLAKDVSAEEKSADKNDKEKTSEGEQE